MKTLVVVVTVLGCLSGQLPVLPRTTHRRRPVGQPVGVAGPCKRRETKVFPRSHLVLPRRSRSVSQSFVNRETRRTETGNTFLHFCYLSL